MSITQSELAEKLGVSRQSIVRAMNGHGKISEETRQRILQAARELGYTEHSNQASRLLNAKRYNKRVKTGIIAVLMRAGDEPMRGIPFFSPILDGIEKLANHNSIDVYNCYLWKQAHLPRLIREGQVDGVITLVHTAQITTDMPTLSMPVVAIMSRLPGAHSLSVEDRVGAYRATCHLLELGHRRIAYLSVDTTTAASRERFAGMQEALQEYGVPLDTTLVEMSLVGMQMGAQGVEALLKRSHDFTALVCYNDFIAMDAVRALEAHDLSVPGDISVVGFDDTSTATNFQPALTSVAFDRFAMGERAVELVYERLELLMRANAAASDDLIEEVFPVKVVVRDSTRRIN